MVNIGILDVGRARLKLATYESISTKATWNDTAPLGDAVSRGDEDSVTAALKQAVQALRNRSDLVISCGGALLRDEFWNTVLSPELRQLSDEFYVLTPEEEGALLLQSTTERSDCALLDIGGGSVQCVWTRNGQVEVRSWPIGTFALEAQYHLVAGKSTLADYEAAAVEIDSLVGPLEVDNCGTLLVGSGLMKRFLELLGEVIGVRQGRWTLENLEDGWRYCASLEELEYEAVFPIAPDFMRGAEKALLLARLFSCKLGVASAEGTDASVSAGIARGISRRSSPDKRIVPGSDISSILSRSRC